MTPVLSTIVVSEVPVVLVDVELLVELVSESEAVPIASSPQPMRARVDARKAKERVRVVSDEVSIRVSVNSLMADLRGFMWTKGGALSAGRPSSMTFNASAVRRVSV